MRAKPIATTSATVTAIVGVRKLGRSAMSHAARNPYVTNEFIACALGKLHELRVNADANDGRARRNSSFSAALSSAAPPQVIASASSKRQSRRHPIEMDAASTSAASPAPPR